MALREDFAAMAPTAPYPVGLVGAPQGTALPPLPIPLHIPFGAQAFHMPPRQSHRQNHDGRIAYAGPPDMAALEEFQKRRNLEQLELSRLSKNAMAGMGRDREKERQISTRLRERIYDSYVGYLGWLQEQQALGRDEDTSSGCGKQKRHHLEELVTDYLCQVMQKEKYHLGMSFELILRHTIERKGTHFDPLRTAEAFRSLEKYACNLLVQPWREEFRRIKLYGGFYKHKIERHLCQPEAVLELLGYVRQGNSMILPQKPLDPDEVTFVALDCLIANVECKVLLLLRSGIRHFDNRWMDVYNMRCQLYGASIAECAIVLTHQYEQKLHSQRTLESMCKEMESMSYGARAREKVQSPHGAQRKPPRLKPGHSNCTATDEVDSRRYRNDPISVADDYHRQYREPGMASGSSGKASRSQAPHRDSQPNLMSPPTPTQQSSRDIGPVPTTNSRGTSYKLLTPTSLNGGACASSFAMPKLGPSPTPPLGSPSTHLSSGGAMREEEKPRRPERGTYFERDDSHKPSNHKDVATQSLESPEDGSWSCSICTFLNDPQANICVMCSKSRNQQIRSAASENLVSGGRECPSCTLINPKSAVRCEACNASLMNSPTYI